MRSSTLQPPLPLPEPAVIRHAAFSDLDETYLAHAAGASERRWRLRLEAFLADAATRHGLLFGWVTGSSLATVMAKVERHGLGAVPHFIAASLGAELVFFHGGEARPDPVWRDRIGQGLPRAAIQEAVATLAGQGIHLVPQPARTADLVASFYYRERGPEPDRDAFARIRAAACGHGLGLNLSRCNPGAGDPADCYDVDLLPRDCGKARVVRYICDKFDVDTANTFAFGDSGNDLEMLAAVRHGVLVANATSEAKAAHPRIAAKPYAAAILATLRQELQATPPR